MLKTSTMNRYAIIDSKNKREITLLLGLGCQWRRCKFCDYHLDFSSDPSHCYAINKKVLSQVTGLYQKLEVINSGSFLELDHQTMDEILRIAQEKSIREVHFESHYSYREKIPFYRQRFKEKGIDLKIKCGVETFDPEFRDIFLDKGMEGASPEEIQEYFDEVCLLFGLTGQGEESMSKDIDIGLRYFDRLCINIMTPNSSKIQPDLSVIQIFTEKIYPNIKNHPRIDVLLNNTDYGVGGAISND